MKKKKKKNPLFSHPSPPLHGDGDGMLCCDERMSKDER
jgi:hypothetical protein